MITFLDRMSALDDLSAKSDVVASLSTGVSVFAEDLSVLALGWAGARPEPEPEPEPERFRLSQSRRGKRNPAQRRKPESEPRQGFPSCPVDPTFDASEAHLRPIVGNWPRTLGNGALRHSRHAVDHDQSDVIAARARHRLPDAG